MTDPYRTDPNAEPPRGPDILEIAPIVLRWLNVLCSDRECAAELARLEAGASGHPAVRGIWATLNRPSPNRMHVEGILTYALDDVLLEEYEWDPREREEYGLSERFAAALSHHMIDIDNPEAYMKALHATRTLERVISDGALDVDHTRDTLHSRLTTIADAVKDVDDVETLRGAVRALVALAKDLA